MLTTATGTTFNIFFRRVAGHAHAPLAHDHPGAAARGTETVLLVEDEPAVRALGARVLRSRGYTVLEAANGVEALRVAVAAGARIDLLLTDVVMPQMGGKALAEQFRALYPRAVHVGLCRQRQLSRQRARRQGLPRITRITLLRVIRWQSLSC